MKVTSMMEMEPHIKARYDFAMSAFSRMYGVSHVSSNKEIFKFCKKWSNTEEEPIPTGTLTSVDFYFRDLWKIWGGYV
jgi:hypothetical protein